MKNASEKYSVALVALVVIFATFVSGLACPVSPAAGVQPAYSDLRTAFDKAAQNLLGTDGPSYPTILKGYPKPTRVTATVPCIILRSVGYIESTGWVQFSNGFTKVSGDCGYGIMQITSGMGGGAGFDPQRVAKEYAYNIGTGAKILMDKWNATPSVGENDPDVAENWYFAVWAYNSFSYLNNPNNPKFNANRVPYDGSQKRADYPYQELVFGIAAHPPSSEFWAPMALTLPNRATITSTGVPSSSEHFSTPSPSHGTGCQSSTTTPVARFTMSGGGQNGSQGQTLTYTVATNGNVPMTFDAAPSSGASSYQWRINTSLVNQARSFNFTLGVGTHVVELTAINTAGQRVTATATIVVNQQAPPVARFTMSGGGQSGVQGQTLTYTVPTNGSVPMTFDAASSSGASSYQWRINTSLVNQARSFNFTLGRGTHVIELTATNTAGQRVTATATIVVNEQAPPVARFTMSGGGQSGGQGQTLIYTVPTNGSVPMTFDAAASSGASSYQWRINTSLVNQARSFNFTLGRGTHVIELTAINSVGQRVTATATIVVNEQAPPVARFTMSGGGRSGSQGQTLTYTVPTNGSVAMTFDASPSSGASSYQWRISTSLVNQARSFNFTLGRGSHLIELTVINAGGQRATATATIIVNQR